ncbi:MAG: DUF2892 domain-containing protein [Burkholderiaceae bacterium]|nr:MAG: DUF2892 domain-containing protein [Burkholderiaceae bacterium]
MSSWNLVRTIAGVFILVSVALGAPASPLYQSSYWLWFTVFVGANLLQSGISQWCLLERILRKLGVRSGDSCGIPSSKS